MSWLIYGGIGLGVWIIVSVPLAAILGPRLKREREERSIPLPESMYERAQLRPPDYAKLSPQQQWMIDKKLGILDWDGSDDRQTTG